MSDLREKVIWFLLNWDVNAERTADRILALFERTAVERERKAFIAGADWQIPPADSGDVENGEAEASRRYPLPKEE